MLGKGGNGVRERANALGQRSRLIGHFKVESDKFCRFFESLENDHVRCFDIYQKSYKLLRFEDGALATIMIPVQ